MEQTNQTKMRRPFTVWHALGLLLIVCTAAAIWFGVHPRYRFLSVAILAVAAFSVWKRNWMLWIVIGVQLGFAIFLWTFPQAGYRIVSTIPLATIAFLLVFRFCKKPVRIAAAIVLSAVVAALLAVEIPIVKAATEKPTRDAEYVIVLGAAVYGEKPSITLEHRLEGAIRYLNENPDTKVVVSGGQGEGEDISEAECMRRYLTENGIDPARILIEDRSTSTKENLAFSKTVIEADGGKTARVAIVSSAYHLYRAEKMAASLGMNASGVASSDGYPIYMFGMYLREAAAVTKLWLFGA